MAKGKCKTCQNNSSIHGLGDANINLLAGAAAGVVASKNIAPMLLDKVEFLATNPMLKSGVKVALGFVLAGMENEMIQGVGIGMAAEAAGNLIGQYLPANMGGDAAVTGMPSNPLARQNLYQGSVRPTLSGMNQPSFMNWQDSPAQKIGAQQPKLVVNTY